jgi:O-antigen ligase
MQLPCVVVLLLQRKSFAKSLTLIVWLCLMTRMLFLNASRGGTLTVLFSFLLTWMLILRKQSPVGIRAGVVVLLLAGGLFAPSLFWDRMGTLQDTNHPSNNTQLASAIGSSEERTTVLYRSIEYTFENPILGLGLGNFEVASGTRSGKGADWIGTHNTYTQISSEAGLPALVVFVWLIGSTLRDLLRISCTGRDDPNQSELNTYARAIMVGLIACSFGALFAHIGYNMYFYPSIGLTVAMQGLIKLRLNTSPLAKNSPGLADGRQSLMNPL